MKTRLDRVLQLLSLPGIGRITVRKLIDNFETFEELSTVNPRELSEITDISLNHSRQLMESLSRSPSSSVQSICMQVEEHSWSYYIYGDKDYPERLKEIYDPPIVLYYQGIMQKSDINSIAVVGTRNPTDYGARVAREFSVQLASSGITVISGCALGIDAIAHKYALSSGGRTIGVLGSGLDNKAPKQNLKLMDKIIDKGVLFAEFNPGEEILPSNFPLRNRIISGLSIATLVIEAPKKSGALITAYQSLEEGREVFAVPGGIFSSRSQGTNHLIKLGATPVTELADILNSIDHLLDLNRLKTAQQKICETESNPERKKILEVLRFGEMHIDKIKVETKIELNKLLKELSNLELSGKIRHIGGKRFIKNG